MILDCRYGDFSAFEGDDLISNSLCEYGEWAQEEINILTCFIDCNDNIIDAGAFIGTHSRALATATGPLGKVFAFEPNSVVYPTLEENSKRAIFNNIITYQFALGSTNEKRAIFNDSNEHNKGATALTPYDESSTSQTIEVKPFDSLDLGEIDFIKADVEGMELLVLAGAETTICNSTPIIYLELNTLQSAQGTIDWAKQRNYSIFGVIVSAFNPRNFKNSSTNMFGNSKECGLLLIHKAKLNRFLSVIEKLNLPELNSADDFSLLLLHKPQYAYEVLNKTTSASSLGILYPAPVAEALAKKTENLLELLNEKDTNIIERDAKIAGQDREITALHQIAGERLSTIKIVNEKCATLQIENERLLGELLHISKLNQDHAKQAKELDYALNQIKTSTSWKLTNPLRALSTLLQKLIPGHQLSEEPRKSWINLKNIKKGIQLIFAGQLTAVVVKALELKSRKANILNRSNNRSAAYAYIQKEKYIARSHDSVDIIIPVYNGFSFLAPLFNSLLNNTSAPYRLIVVNDYSSDPNVSLFLQSQKSRFSSMLLLTNEKNIGFIASVNKAAALTTSHFVILNTDTELPPNWLERLMGPIFTDPSVASTTPFTNAGTICSFPDICQDNSLFLGMSYEAIDECFNSIAQSNPAIEIPTGVGFCMGINQQVVKKIGMFDPIFGRGYAEENDWCMRAKKAGYTNVLVNNLFVFHKHGGSFLAEEKAKLIEGNLRLLGKRHPEYFQLVNEHINEDPAKGIRLLAELILRCRASVNRPALIIDHNIGGGTNTYRQQIISQMAQQNIPAITFFDDFSTGKLMLTLTHQMEDIELLLKNTEHLVDICGQIPISQIIYNSAVSHDSPLSTISAAIDIHELTKAKLLVAFHDFFLICPSYTLLNADGVYCDVPAIEICMNCLPKNKADFIKPATNIKVWRSTCEDFLERADEIICFSENSRLIVEKAYPDIRSKISVQPHKINFKPTKHPKLDFSEGLHIGVVGGINEQKGLLILLSMLDEISARSLNIRITVIGAVSIPLPPKALLVTGAYKKEDLSDLIESLGINVCFMPSIWPETFSFVTDELISLNVPLACFNIGAPAERVKEYEHGMIISEINPKIALKELQAFYDNLLSCPQLRLPDIDAPKLKSRTFDA